MVSLITETFSAGIMFHKLILRRLNFCWNKIINCIVLSLYAAGFWRETLRSTNTVNNYCIDIRHVTRSQVASLGPWRFARYM